MSDDEGTGEGGAGHGERRADDPEPDAERGDSEPGETTISPVSAAKSSLLWGVIGGLSFLVLIQGYELATDRGVSLAVKFGVAVLVGVLAGASTYAVRGRLPPANESA